jgi:ligand-binding sensor protein
MNDTFTIINKSKAKALLNEIISIEQLQRLQDTFTATTNVASILIDLNGDLITKPSNFTKICSLVQKTEKGGHLCNTSNLERSSLAGSINQPTYLKCHPCGFGDASIPVFVNGERVANWLLGQINLDDTNRNEIADFALVIGVDISEMLMAFDQMPKMSSSKFESIIKLLFKISTEIMNLGFQRYQSNEFDDLYYENEIQKRFDSILNESTLIHNN